MIDLNAMSVLIVDDMESMRRSIRSMFKVLRVGKTMLHASNGREAWNILKNKPVDIAIIDWNMPVMNGIELLNRIRNDKKMRDMPVIMITAEAEKEIIVEVAESDIDAYLLKPLTTRSLEEKIKSVVDRANDPPPARRHFLKAREFEENGEIDAAIEEVKLALKNNLSSSKILRKLGLLYLEKDNIEIAEKCLRKAVAVNKQDALSRYHLGELYSKKDELMNAIKYYEQAITISPRNISKGIMDFGELLIKKDLNAKAVEMYRKMIKYSDDPLSYSEQIAEICLQNGEYPYAKELLSSIIKDVAERYDLVFKAGVAYEKSGDPDTALMYYKTVDENVSDNIDAKLRLAKIYMGKRKVFLADELLNEILIINPEHEEALKLRKQNW